MLAAEDVSQVSLRMEVGCIDSLSSCIFPLPGGGCEHGVGVLRVDGEHRGGGGTIMLIILLWGLLFGCFFCSEWTKNTIFCPVGWAGLVVWRDATLQPRQLLCIHFLNPFSATIIKIFCWVAFQLWLE